MFYSISGKIVRTDVNGVAVQCGPVAFYCFASFNTLRRIGASGSDVLLYTHLNVKEDALDLYGF